MLVQTGTIFNIMRYSTHDGPGIRTTVFLKGCPLSCWWCHNPEGIAFEPEVVSHPDRCIRCGACVGKCATGGVADRTLCIRCGACVTACNTGAREIIGSLMTVSQVMARVEQDVIFYDESGGGVTFSGGEPTAQPEFLMALLKASGAHGIHRALDTSGYAPADVMMKIAEDVDLFLYDLKAMDDSKHVDLTGVSNRTIIENLRMLSDMEKRIIVRFPMVPGLNDDIRNIDAMAELVASLKIEALQVLPYHRTGSGKYDRLSSDYRLQDLMPPTAKRVDEVRSRLKAAGIKVIQGG